MPIFKAYFQADMFKFINYEEVHLLRQKTMTGNLVLCEKAK